MEEEAIKKHTTYRLEWDLAGGCQLWPCIGKERLLKGKCMTERWDVLHKTSVCAELGHPLLAETALCQKVFWTSEVLVYY